MKSALFVVTLVGMFTMCSAAGAAESVKRVEGITIRGSQEQPKVLYIVPWQPPVSPSLNVPEPKTDLDVLKPLERGFYRQSLYYRKHLKLGTLPDSP